MIKKIRDIKVDKTSRFLARLFGLVFAWSLFDLLSDGAFSYTSMGHDKTVTANSNPLRFYFSVAWCGLMLPVCLYFGFIAKLQTHSEGDK